MIIERTQEIAIPISILPEDVRPGGNFNYREPRRFEINLSPNFVPQVICDTIVQARLKGIVSGRALCFKVISREVVEPGRFE